jgi:TrmH family RNA methyltransferase
MITSIKNPQVQFVRALLTQKKHRDEAGAFVVEGVRLAEEALAAHYTPTLALYSTAMSERGKALLASLDKSAAVEEIDAELLNRISATETSQGLLIVFRKKGFSGRAADEPVLVLDLMRDPGNLGTILRSASTFGFARVILTPGSVDPFSPKVLRAGMGAQFKLPVDFMSAEEIRQFCKSGAKKALNICLADAAAQSNCWQIDFTLPLCLIIGSEAFGVTPEIRLIVDTSVLIPMQANNESLNAAMSANILMYEVYRQRKSQ